MKPFLQTVFPKEFFTHAAHVRAMVLGILYLGTAIAQLYTYENFGAVVAGFGLPGGEVVATIVAVLLPLIACAALPYLLSMRLSTQLRVVSRAAVVVAPSVWLLLAVWLNLAPDASKLNSGIFGATITASVGLWMILFSSLWVWAAAIVVRELPIRK